MVDKGLQENAGSSRLMKVVWFLPGFLPPSLGAAEDMASWLYPLLTC